jgi:hypothetical protein
MSNRELAIKILAFEDTFDNEEFEHAYAHYEEKFDGWLQEEHSGDCKKQPWTCCRCVAESALKRAVLFKKVFPFRIER